MQTFAHPAADDDLFDPIESRQPEHIGFDATLLSQAVVRCKPMGDQLHVVPVVCLELRCDSPGQQVIHAQQIYTDEGRRFAEMMAKHLPKGARVHVTTALTDMHITLPNVASITLLDTTVTPHP